MFVYLFWLIFFAASSSRFGLKSRNRNRQVENGYSRDWPTRKREVMDIVWFPGCDVKLDLNLTYTDYDSRGACSDGRVAEVFEGLTFVTVIGAGHEVPMSKPHAAFELFKYFLRGKPLPK
ncbi:hypothetical protein F2Q70_00037869 [Brassica cretica]|uniref:Uncharacterized protein n=1 Tax=Brassica cretica TaxID=69181 RepID=A0A8S9G7Z7_BRACR|nr:hypothetical protein F2Q68_00033312 [Brassica cretica]KAF2584878.1 hypothetical protein F2Q70_00037869 [Brassica cretica]